MVCRNCGRGYEHDYLPFVCEVCGATNHEDGSIEYDADTREMEYRIDQYDAEDIDG